MNKSDLYGALAIIAGLALCFAWYLICELIGKYKIKKQREKLKEDLFAAFEGDDFDLVEEIGYNQYIRDEKIVTIKKRDITEEILLLLHEITGIKLTPNVDFKNFIGNTLTSETPGVEYLKVHHAILKIHCFDFTVNGKCKTTLFFEVEKHHGSCYWSSELNDMIYPYKKEKLSVYSLAEKESIDKSWGKIHKFLSSEKSD